jgi:hypothetical protein
MQGDDGTGGAPVNDDGEQGCGRRKTDGGGVVCINGGGNARAALVGGPISLPCTVVDVPTPPPQCSSRRRRHPCCSGRQPHLPPWHGGRRAHPSPRCSNGDGSTLAAVVVGPISLPVWWLTCPPPLPTQQRAATAPLPQWSPAPSPSLAHGS